MTTKTFFEEVAAVPRLMPTVLIGEVVWKPLQSTEHVGSAGWYHRHECGRLVHAWMAPQRPSHVQCPGCQKWVQAP